MVLTHGIEPRVLFDSWSWIGPINIFHPISTSVMIVPCHPDLADQQMICFDSRYVLHCGLPASLDSKSQTMTFLTFKNRPQTLFGPQDVILDSGVHINHGHWGLCQLYTLKTTATSGFGLGGSSFSGCPHKPKGSEKAFGFSLSACDPSQLG